MWEWQKKTITEQYDIKPASRDELYHWGILGQKWGRRRFQLKDGSLTPEGRERYGVGEKSETETVKSENPEFEKSYNSFKQSTDAIKDLTNGFDYNSKDFEEYSSRAGIAQELLWNENVSIRDISYGSWSATHDGGESLTNINEMTIKTMDDGTFDDVKKAVNERRSAYDEIRKSDPKAIKDNKELSDFGYTLEDDMVNGAGKRSNEELGKAIKLATTINENMKKYGGVNERSMSGWNNFNEALEALDMENIPAKDMTRSDWEKINKYIRENL